MSGCWAVPVVSFSSQSIVSFIWANKNLDGRGDDSQQLKISSKLEELFTQEPNSAKLKIQFRWTK
jgi:hypothetical protein